MEPSAKRLRIPRSAQADEDDDEYMRKKQEAEATLRNTFENIFAKYENMPESRSDVFDMKKNKLIVDNGHWRRLANDPKGRAASRFLADMIDDEDYDEDSADELAPSEPSVSRKPEGGRQRRADQAHTQENTQPAVPPADQTPNAPPVALDQSQLLNTLAQIPLNQQNQNTLLMNLGQFVVQAVSQLLPQALPNHLGIAPISPPSGVPTLSPVTTPTTGQVWTPPTDPKWWCPTLPTHRTQPALPLSSPIPHPPPARKRRSPFVGARHNGKVKRRPSPKVVVPAHAEQATTDLLGTVSLQEDKGNPESEDVGHILEGQESIEEKSRYDLSMEESVYVLKQRLYHKCTFEQIKDSRAEWKEWPTHVFHQHCLRHNGYDPDEPSDSPNAVRDDLERALDGAEHQQGPQSAPEAQGLHETTPAAKISPEQFQGRSHQAQTADLLSSPHRQHQLPTPSSLVHFEGSDHPKYHWDGEPSHSDTVAPRQLFNEEDVELLSLGGDGGPCSGTSTDAVNVLEASVPTSEIIVPSIEMDDPVEEHIEQRRELMHPQVEVQAKVPRLPSKPEPITVHQKSPSSPQSLPRKKRKFELANFPVESDSEDIDIVPTGREVPEQTVLPKSFPASLDCDHPDELDAPLSPFIKREPSTPRPCSLLAVPLLQTPKSTSNLSALGTPACNGTSKLSRSQFVRKVRAQWAKQGRSGTPQTARHRNLQGSTTKRWQDESEDELAW